METNEKLKMSTSDILALDRTRLANERTLLAYVRTVIGMLSAGIAILKVFDFPWTEPIAYFLLAAAFPTLVIGLYRYFSTDNRLNGMFGRE